MLAERKLPFWMLQRQITSETVDDHTLRLIGPILPTCEIGVLPVAKGPGHRVAIDRVTDAGKATVVQTEVPFENESAAWQAAFELYRQHVIV